MLCAWYSSCPSPEQYGAVSAAPTVFGVGACRRSAEAEQVSPFAGLGCIQVYPNSWTSSRYPSSMNEFLRVAYGAPCRECGFDWSVEPATCVAIVSDAPARFTSVLAGHD